MIRLKFPCIFGLRKNEEMDHEEFEKYLYIGIVPLSHDAFDTCTMQILIKLDCGPARMNQSLLLNQISVGSILIPVCQIHCH